jgi:hypothetical protein
MTGGRESIKSKHVNGPCTCVCTVTLFLATRNGNHDITIPYSIFNNPSRLRLMFYLKSRSIAMLMRSDRLSVVESSRMRTAQSGHDQEETLQDFSRDQLLLNIIYVSCKVQPRKRLTGTHRDIKGSKKSIPGNAHIVRRFQNATKTQRPGSHKCITPPQPSSSIAVKKPRRSKSLLKPSVDASWAWGLERPAASYPAGFWGA